MKKISRTIAMLLVLVMLASTFTGCEELEEVGAFLGGIVVLGLIALYIVIVDADLPDETGIYLAGTHDPLADYFSAMDRFSSLPEAEQLAFIEKINSLPEEKRASLTWAVSSLPESEINASARELNALSEEEFLSAVQDFNALNESDLDSLLHSVNQRAVQFAVMNSVASARKRTELCLA